MTRLPKPLGGRRSQRWTRWRLQQGALVWRRCRGHCEATGCTQPATEKHHVFMRRHIVAEPLASHHTLLAGLCADHHRLVTLKPGCEVELQLMQAALERGYATWNRHVYVATAMPRDIYCGEARALEEWLRSNDEWDQLLVDAGRDR